MNSRRSFFTSLAKAAAIVLLCLTGCRKDETEFDCGLPGCLECESIRTARVPRVIYKTQIAGGTYLSFQKGGHIFISYNHGLIHDPNCGCMKGKP